MSKGDSYSREIAIKENHCEAQNKEIGPGDLY